MLNGIKLKGEENYIVWKKVIKDIAVVNGLKCYIYKKGKILKYIDKFNKKVNEIKLIVWLT